MDELAGGSANTQFRGLYYLGSQMAQALTEFQDEEGHIPTATWSVSAIEFMAFSQLAARYSTNSFWGIVQYTEQPGGSFLWLDDDATRALCGANKTKKLNEDDTALLDLVLSHVTEAFAQSWSDIVNLEPQLGTFNEAPSLADLQEIFTGLAPNTPIAITTFRVSVPGHSAVRITLGTPQPYLIPLEQSLAAAAELTIQGGNDDAIDERLDYLAEVPIAVTVSLGSTQMTVFELQNLEEADVILLDQLITAPLAINIGGARLLGMPGTTQDGLRRAVQIVSMVADG